MNVRGRPRKRWKRRHSDKRQRKKRKLSKVKEKICIRELANRQQESLHPVMKITHEDLKNLEEHWQLNDSSCKIHNNEDHALLHFYMNSGCTRFNEHLSYYKDNDSKPIDTKTITEEIANERLSESELKKIINDYFQAYNFNTPLLSCGSCGIRQFESTNDTASIRYTRHAVDSLPQIYTYSPEQKTDLLHDIDRGPIRIPCCSGEESGEMLIQPWKIRSYFESSNGLYYHLHPELVDVDSTGTEWTFLCPRCTKAANKGKAYKLSIAGGVDFGNYYRIPGLEPPNLHEQMIISKYRLYSAVIKVCPNGRGFQQTHGMNTMRGNQILFAHDSVTKVDHALLQHTAIEEMIQVHFYDDKDNIDNMAKRAFGTNKLYARSSVLLQWLLLLKRCHPGYSELDDATISNVVEETKKAVDKMKSNPSYITDESSLNYEKGLGSDVAGVQQVDSLVSNYNEEGGTVQNIHLEDELPIRTHFVSKSPETVLKNPAIQRRIEAESLRDIMVNQANNDFNARSDDDEEETDNDSHKIRTDASDFIDTLFNNVNTDNTVSQVIKSKRSQFPVSEMDPTDELLTTSFPWLFLTGKAYGRTSGNLNTEQLNHMLKQFHTVQAKDKRLLGYLADVKRRFEVITKARLKISGNEDAVAKVNEFMANTNNDTIAKLLKENPNHPKAKKIWSKLRNLLTVIGGNVMYGALESSRCITQTIETARRYGHGCAFLTLSLDDIHNTRGIRASMKTISNDRFPANFNEQDQFKSAGDLMTEIIKQSVLQSEGIIDITDGEGMKLRRSHLSQLACDNPVAYVNETKCILHHVLAILIGRTPEGFFGAYDGTTNRTSRFWKRCKGIFGHILAFAGVVEDHVKGTLHFHIILHGSLSTYVLQTLSCVPEICSEIAKTLDSMYTAKFSTKTNFRNVLARTIAKSCNIRDLKSEKISPPPLLQRDKPLQMICFDSSDVPFSLLTRIHKCTANERAKMCFHEHHRTCRKGFHGRCRCRFAKKSGISCGTRCVMLQPRCATIETSATDSNDILEEMHDDLEDEMRALFEADNNDGSDNQEDKQETKDEKYLYDVKAVPACQHPCYTLRNPLIRENDPMIVWELDRTVPSLAEIPQLQEQNIEHLIDSVRNLDEHSTRTRIIHNLKLLLEYEEGTVGRPFNEMGREHLWDFLQNHSIKVVHELYCKTMEAMKTANQYVVDHNVVLSFCTGSHNNAVLLGGPEQAKSATFYIAPYMAKEKVSLVACLTILEKARREVLTYGSRATDRETKPQERLAKHFLTKVANKLNAYVELSDYQVSAYLLAVPSILTSETFAYTEPYGAMNYREKLLHDIFMTKEANGTSNFGYVRTFACEKGTESGKKSKIAIPVVAMYYHRGEKLKHLSLYEFDSIIQVKQLPADDKRSRSAWFNFEGGFELQAQFGMTLCRKQRTLIFKGAQPKHPGIRPPTDDVNDTKFKQWKRKADCYARYILTMFKPSCIYKGSLQKIDQNTMNLCQGWDELETYVSQLQNDDSVISKFRLMAMDRRMNLLTTNHVNKKILSNYRARDADQWTTYEKGVHKKEDRMQRRFEMEDLQQMADTDYPEDIQYQPLSSKSSKCAYELHKDAVEFVEAARMVPDPSTRSKWTVANENGNISHTLLPCDDDLEWDRKCEWIYNDDYLDSDDEESANNENNHESISHEVLAANNESAQNNLGNSIDTDDLNHEQRMIVSLYSNYLLEDNEIQAAKPPPIVLLTGIGGTGKSYVIHKLLEYGKANHDGFQTVLTTANNNLNAADVEGSTIASLLKQAFSEKKTTDTTQPQRRINPFAISELQKQNIKRAKMLIIDEISNVVAEKIGQLSRLFGSALENEDLFFGGLPVLLVGDYNQKEPVGELATTTLLKYMKNEEGDMHHPQNSFSIASDSALGCNILSNAKWFELTIAQRSSDKAHNDLNSEMYKGTPIQLSKLHMYDIYNKPLLQNDPPEEKALWTESPVIVKTNKERIYLNYERAKEFAIFNLTYLFKWQCNYDNWAGKPRSADATNELIEHDPSFWEIFVAGGPCYLTDTISKKKKLCNGTRARYHSIILNEQGMKEFREQKSCGITIIVLSEPPHGINIQICDKKVLTNQTIDWKDYQDPSYILPQTQNSETDNHDHPKPIIVPIRMRETKPTSQSAVYVVSPSFLVGPARVRIHETFPIRGGFAITVDKAQGQTLDRVIVALSHREHAISNFTYPCVYVSNSRVRQSKHLRLLLKKEQNQVKQWQSLVYLTSLRKNKSIDAFFSGFNKDRRNWVDDEWDKTKALGVYNAK